MVPTRELLKYLGLAICSVSFVACGGLYLQASESLSKGYESTGKVIKQETQEVDHVQRIFWTLDYLRHERRRDVKDLDVGLRTNCTRMPPGVPPSKLFDDDKVCTFATYVCVDHRDFRYAQEALDVLNPYQSTIAGLTKEAPKEVAALLKAVITGQQATELEKEARQVPGRPDCISKITTILLPLTDGGPPSPSRQAILADTFEDTLGDKVKDLASAIIADGVLNDPRTNIETLEREYGPRIVDSLAQIMKEVKAVASQSLVGVPLRSEATPAYNDAVIKILQPIFPAPEDEARLKLVRNFLLNVGRKPLEQFPEITIKVAVPAAVGALEAFSGVLEKLSVTILTGIYKAQQERAITEFVQANAVRIAWTVNTLRNDPAISKAFGNRTKAQLLLPYLQFREMLAIDRDQHPLDVLIMAIKVDDNLAPLDSLLAEDPNKNLADSMRKAHVNLLRLTAGRLTPEEAWGRLVHFYKTAKAVAEEADKLKKEWKKTKDTLSK